MSHQRTQRAAFTLVELLAVMVVLGILAGMVTAALSSVKETARAAKTRAIITSIDEVLQAKWEEYRVRPFSVEVVNPYASDATVTPALRPVEAARIRLQMVRDMMRMEIPDRQSDVLTPPMYNTFGGASGIAARVHPRGAPGGPYSPTVADWWSVGADAPALYVAYNERVTYHPNGDLRWSDTHQGAECLYLILSTTFQNGLSGLEMIPPGNIGDTDEDGMLEILDGWERPLGFLRWPVGAATADIDNDDEFIGPDEFDPFRADFGYRNGDGSVVQPFSLRPLVVSAGPDGIFDIRFTKSTDYTSGSRPASSAFGYAYRNQTWPRNRYPTTPVDESIVRPPTHYYIDPYQRYDPDANGPELFGEPLDADGDGDNFGDNISNYNLEVSS